MEKKEKIRFAFDLHDLDNSGFIDRYELKVLIKQSFIENNLDFDEFQLDLLVEEFFKKADKDHSDTIDFDEFLDVAHQYPDFIAGFAVNPSIGLFRIDEDALAQANKSNIPNKKSKQGFTGSRYKSFQVAVNSKIYILLQCVDEQKKYDNKYSYSLLAYYHQNSRIISFSTGYFPICTR